MRACACCVLLLVFGTAGAADKLRVAVASNFIETFDEIAAVFADETGIEAVPSTGSTGQLFAQIVRGAPFEVFLAADVLRPERLEARGLVPGGARFTYAFGRLVVWSSQANDCLAVLRDEKAGRVAIANPDTAPYGAAARDFLRSIDAWNPSRLVQGANAMQARAFAVTGNAVAAIIPVAQVSGPMADRASCLYEVPATRHQAIEQQAVLLDGASDAALRFIGFLQSPEARSIIEAHGYGAPQ